MIKTNLLFRKSEAGFPKKRVSKKKADFVQKKKQSPNRLILTKKVSYPEKKQRNVFPKKNQIKYLLHKDLIIIENIIIR